MWVVQVEEDPETGQLYLPFPVDLLSQMGWSEGTELFWESNGDKSFTLAPHKKTVNSDYSEDIDVVC